MAVHVDELQIVLVIDEEEVVMSRRLEARHVGLGQGHAGVEATDVAVVIEAGIASRHDVPVQNPHPAPPVTNHRPPSPLSTR